MKITPRTIAGFSIFTAIFLFLIKEMSTPRRSAQQTAPKSPSAGGNPLLGVEPFQGVQLNEPDVEMETEPEPQWITAIFNLLEGDEQGKRPVWWSDFWTGVGTLALALLVGALLTGLVILAVDAWVHYRWLLLVIPIIPLIALFGHLARDMVWNDHDHKH